MAPAGTPAAVIDQLNAEVQKALMVPAVKARLEDMGGEARGHANGCMGTFGLGDVAGWVGG